MTPMAARGKGRIYFIDPLLDCLFEGSMEPLFSELLFSSDCYFEWKLGRLYFYCFTEVNCGCDYILIA